MVGTGNSPCLVGLRKLTVAAVEYLLFIITWAFAHAYHIKRLCRFVLLNFDLPIKGCNFFPDTNKTL